MISKIPALTGAIAVAVAVCFLGTAPASAKEEADKPATQAELAALQAELDAAEADLLTAQEDLAALQADLDAAEADLLTAQEDLVALQADLDAAEADLLTAQEDLVALQGALESETSAREALEGTIAALEADSAALQEQVDALEAIVDPSKTVFVTSGLYTGDLVSEATALGFPGGTGLDAGDYICNVHAQDAGLTGDYVAWLSDSFTDAVDRFPTSGPWNLTDGSPVAVDLDDIIDGVLLNSLHLTEDGALASASWRPWTSTLHFGVVHQSGNASCDDWGWTSGGLTISFGGRTNETIGVWSIDLPSIDCSSSQPLFCFQR
jgi:flagellar motility protein MotE (MotC chaperone)